MGGWAIKNFQCQTFVEPLRKPQNFLNSPSTSKKKQKKKTFLTPLIVVGVKISVSFLDTNYLVWCKSVIVSITLKKMILHSLPSQTCTQVFQFKGSTLNSMSLCAKGFYGLIDPNCALRENFTVGHRWLCIWNFNTENLRVMLKGHWKTLKIARAKEIE